MARVIIAVASSVTRQQSSKKSSRIAIRHFCGGVSPAPELFRLLSAEIIVRQSPARPKLSIDSSGLQKAFFGFNVIAGCLSSQAQLNPGNGFSRIQCQSTLQLTQSFRIGIGISLVLGKRKVIEG